MIDHDSNMSRGRIHLPASPACGRWETMLVDALDQQLSAEDQAFFDQHRAGCSNCAALLEQSSCGRQWLACLDAAPEPPHDLMDRILRHTGPGLIPAAAMPQVAGAVAPVWQQPVGRMAWLRRFSEPRLMMTAAMAFFSIALTLSLTRTQLRQMHAPEMNPGSMRAALERRIATASTPVVRYYDHLRFLYEVESRVREMQRSTENSPQAQPQNPGGGSQLRMKRGGLPDPHSAPQQTVNPPLLIESQDPVEATLQPGLDRTSVAEPATALERSQPCSA
jgi:hypothetical protein